MTTGGPSATGGRATPLAYLFWHQSARGPVAAYEAALSSFHSALAVDPPLGFAGSWTMSLARSPWFGDGAPCYLDWYVVEDFTALGRLHEAAVDRVRTAVHDAVAGLNGAGTGGLVALGSGDPAAPSSPTLSFVDKPKGVAYGRFRTQLDGAVAGRGAWWMRQMAMGPGPEVILVTAEPVESTRMPHVSLGPCRMVGGGWARGAEEGERGMRSCP